MERVRTMWAFMRLGRWHFLGGGVVLHLLGVAIAWYAGARLNLTAILWGQITITATQWMTHYANDYFDLEADRANQTPTRWSGGSRVLVASLLPERVALVAALGLAGVALMGNVVVSVWVRPGLMTFGLLLLAQTLAWCYSAPPIRLHSRGLGEVTTMLVVTLLTPLTGYYLQVGRFDGLPFLAMMPLCCLQLAMLLSIEFPDAEGDRSAGKRTLVVRLGSRRASRLYGLLLLAVYAMLPALVWAGLPLTVGLSIAALSPLAGGQVWRIQRGDWHDTTQWNRLAFYTIVLLMGTAAAELAAFMLLTGV